MHCTQQGGLSALDAPSNVLQHDDRIVHDEPDCEHGTKQRQRIDGVPEQRHDDCGCEDRDRNGHGRDQRCAPGTEEHENHHEHDQQRLEQHRDDLAHRLGDKHGEIEIDLAGDVLRQRALHEFDFARDSLRDIEHVGLRSRDDADADPGQTVRACEIALILGRKPYFRHITEAYEVPIGRTADDERAKVLRRLHRRPRAQGELPLARFDAPRRQLDVLAPQRRLDIVDGELPRSQRLAIDPDTHRITAAAREARRGHAGQRTETVDDVAIDVLAQLERAALGAGEIDIDDWLGRVVHLGNLRRLGLLRQARSDA